LTRPSHRVVLENKWRGVRLHRSPMHQIRVLNDVIAADHADHLKAELAVCVGNRRQRGRRVEIHRLVRRGQLVIPCAVTVTLKLWRMMLFRLLPSLTVTVMVTTPVAFNAGLKVNSALLADWCSGSSARARGVDCWSWR